ncbi:uncharacterized protein EDB91DRAFT_1076292 [Suillus paluster]|uniref:uncharacterized protein n=1 Tax=Suillus paluster TaxID=48578 RepID=UPI001B8780AC|nr:uncharacterized protein EDB91DRAFT_1076292 [Suillus paluster]KAG1756191.1 hypothetical protein EDB91DRAFT_1076292 [Suillus paluster]
MILLCPLSTPVVPPLLLLSASSCLVWGVGKLIQVVEDPGVISQVMGEEAIHKLELAYSPMQVDLEINHAVVLEDPPTPAMLALIHQPSRHSLPPSLPSVTSPTPPVTPPAPTPLVLEDPAAPAALALTHLPSRHSPPSSTPGVTSPAPPIAEDPFAHQNTLVASITVSADFENLGRPMKLTAVHLTRLWDMLGPLIDQTAVECVLFTPMDNYPLLQHLNEQGVVILVNQAYNRVITSMIALSMLGMDLWATAENHDIIYRHYLDLTTPATKEGEEEQDTEEWVGFANDGEDREIPKDA